ncbi:hypothetical protein [Actinoplanes palleronii]|uniref:Uncharacterized protein n=1 Tax=Actinoplanes palleronii TaxID=113570 RepID=A0ABQ4BN07_9ACTN|nr:hypothetical protein [Actinoplanes palleronii]GIE72061.1 hypothetical protein Apa02nite_081690 [Actinoplanes palleronii]
MRMNLTTKTFQRLLTSASGLDTPLGALRPIANQCTAGNCPTIYLADSEPAEVATAVVQGYVVTAEQAGIDLPHGEVLVRVPVSLLTEAVHNLSRQSAPPGGAKEV